MEITTMGSPLVGVRNEPRFAGKPAPETGLAACAGTSDVYVAPKEVTTHEFQPRRRSHVRTEPLGEFPADRSQSSALARDRRQLATLCAAAARADCDPQKLWPAVSLTRRRAIKYARSAESPPVHRACRRGRNGESRFRHIRSTSRSDKSRSWLAERCRVEPSVPCGTP